MTTDQIKDANRASDARDGSPALHAAVEQAADEASRIVAKARLDAFHMVTDARRDADAILEEARSAAAEIVAANEVDGALVSENADLLAVNAALRVEYNELASLIEDSHKLIGALDTRLLDLATMPDAIPSLDGSVDEVAHDVGRQVAPFVIDYSPAVAPAPRRSRSVSTERAESFYTRKSAKLPRIGEEGGRDALDVVKSMRDRMRDRDAS